MGVYLLFEFEVTKMREVGFLCGFLSFFACPDGIFRNPDYDFGAKECGNGMNDKRRER